MKKSPQPNNFTTKLYQAETIPLKLSPKTEKEGTVWNSFFESSIILTPKSIKNTKENYWSIFLMSMDINILENTTREHIKIIYTMTGLTSFSSTWCKIEASVKRVSKLRKCIRLAWSLWGIYMINNWCGKGPVHCGRCHPGKWSCVMI